LYEQKGFHGTITVWFDSIKAVVDLMFASVHTVMALAEKFARPRIFRPPQSGQACDGCQRGQKAVVSAQRASCNPHANLQRHEQGTGRHKCFTVRSQASKPRGTDPICAGRDTRFENAPRAEPSAIPRVHSVSQRLDTRREGWWQITWGSSVMPSADTQTWLLAADRYSKQAILKDHLVLGTVVGSELALLTMVAAS